MDTLIIGAGEIGKSLFSVLDKYYKCHVIDKGEAYPRNFEIIHICFPYSEEFKKQVKEYQESYSPKHTVIHATVPVGTSKSLNALHSPVVGIHPHLEESITTFTKFFGGENASEVADYFRRAGVKVSIHDKAETTELMKIMSTTFYGLSIEFTKEMKRLCDKYQVPFEAWTLWNNNYNSGYEKLGYPEYKKPNLVPMMKKVGGHCVRENMELDENVFTKLLKDVMNKE